MPIKIQLNIHHIELNYLLIREMKPIVFLLIFVALFNPSGHAQVVRIVHRDGAGHLNTTTDQHRIMIEDKCAPAKPCEPGLILPIWGSEVFDLDDILLLMLNYISFRRTIFLSNYSERSFI